ncbi:AAA ATPase-like protein [Allonocardiopsis opalescens]|uniref:AAA ATPase-like protein n=2 Tax=Allonocardiopsis opalescens TaxID=1144618 RepID=A0A2T0QD32_9ACTN|nr:AAA ATPase-like protein [Allonocardiopsis opalescens]
MGPISYGKTELLRVFGEQAAESGVTWLSSSCSPLERDLPLGVMNQLFHTAALPADHRARAAQTLREAVHHPTGTEDAGDWLSLAPRLWTVLLELSESRPLLITVDDVEYADLPSLHLLLYLVRRITSARIFVLLAAADRPQRVCPILDVDLLHHPACERIRLNPLSIKGVADVVTHELAGAADEATAAAVYRISGGNPLLVTAITEDYRNAVKAANGAEPAGIPVGETYARSVLTLLHRGDPDTLLVARALAVLGEHGSPRLVADLVDRTADTVGQALRSLRAIGLFGVSDYRHPSARSAVLNDIDPHDRVEAHRRAAHLVHAEGAAATTIADHLVRAAHHEPPWALELLRDAATQAVAAGRHDAAIRYLRLASRATTDEGERALVTSLLARAEWLLNPAIAERHAAPLHAAAGNGVLGRSDTFSSIRFLLWYGYLDEATDLLRKLGSSADELDLEDAASLEITGRWLSLTFPGVFQEVSRDLPPFDQTGVVPSSFSVYLQAVRALDTVLRRGPDIEAARTADQVLRHSAVDEPFVEAMDSALSALIHADQLDKARHYCSSLHDELSNRGSPTWQAYFSSVRAYIELRQGRLSAALEHITAALRIMPLRNWGTAVCLPLAVLIRAHTETGDYESALASVRHPIPESHVKTRWGFPYLYSRAQYYLRIHNFRAALSDFLACGRLMRELDLDSPALAPWRTGAAEAYLGLGESEPARKLLNEQQALQYRQPARVRGNLLRVQAAAGEPRQRPALLRQAVDVLQESGDGLELAYSLVALTRALDALGDSNKARMIGHRAETVITDCGAEPLRRALSYSGGGDSGGSGESSGAAEGIGALSDAEQRVASLAASGYTNREIAGKLYITVSTVEQHLTRIYRKLAVNGRSNLPVLFHQNQKVSAE